LALVKFPSSHQNQSEGLPVKHPIKNYAMLLKTDFNINKSNQLGISYNFDTRRTITRRSNVATYGNSANGIEGPSKINNLNVNLFTTFSPRN